MVASFPDDSGVSHPYAIPEGGNQVSKFYDPKAQKSQASKEDTRQHLARSTTVDIEPGSKNENYLLAS
jgi:hypothetical protein